MNIFGKNIKLSVSGEMRGPCLLITLDGLPIRETLDIDGAWKAATRRVPGAAELGSEQQQEEAPVIISGLRDGVTDGAPLAVLLRVQEESQPTVNAPRPGHEDLAALARSGCADFSGGAYSGRLNTSIAFAGAVCAQILARKQIEASARVAAIGGAYAEELDFGMKKELLDARGTGDSVGSVVECVVTGVPAGLGSPVFDGVESRIAALLFSIPGVKGVEFGLGFGFAYLKGSAANDQIILHDRSIITETNNSGGADAGITTGHTLIVRMALRPNPAISREQRTVEMSSMEEIPLRLRGRHEPCLGPRAVPVMEGALALCLLDAILDQ